MKFKDEVGFYNWKAKNTDDYGAAVFRFAEKWANKMEELSPDKFSEKVANETQFSCDGEGITGFMFGAAVAILAKCWIYGDDIKKWHNKKMGQPDAKGVVNPALMVMKK